MNFGNFWNTHAMRANPGAAPGSVNIPIEFLWDSRTDPNTNPHTRVVITDLLRGLRALKQQYPVLNAVTYSYYLSSLLEAEAANNQTVTIRANVPAYYRYPDAARTAQARSEWAKVLAHELGHAHLFTGHIIPDANDSTANFDLMQKGQDSGWPPFIVRESRPYLRLAVGMDWSPSNVKAALDMITTSTSVPWGMRAHDAFQNAQPSMLAPWTWIDDVDVQEAAGSATFLVRLSAPAATTIYTDYATVNGTAMAGSDYTAAVGPLTISPGTTLSRTITVPISSDTRDEPDEQFSAYIDTATFSTQVKVSDSKAVCTIRDDDNPPSISIADLERHLGRVQRDIPGEVVHGDECLHQSRRRHRKNRR